MPVQHVLKRGSKAQACIAAYICIPLFLIFFFAWSKLPPTLFWTDSSTDSSPWSACLQQHAIDKSLTCTPHESQDGVHPFQIVSDRFRSFQIVSDRFRSFQIVSDRFRSFQIGSERFRSLQIVSDRFRSFQIVSDRFRSFQIVSDRFRSFQTVSDRFTFSACFCPFCIFRHFSAFSAQRHFLAGEGHLAAMRLLQQA